MEQADYAHRLQTMGGNKFREIFSWLNLPDNKYEQSKQRLYARKLSFMLN